MKVGGPRPGAGRPKGGRNEKTLERERVLAQVQLRIMRSANSLFNASKSLAVGTQLLYRVDTNAKGVRSKPIFVTDESEVEAYVDSLNVAGESSLNDRNTYYFITTKEPNELSIKNLMDRAFGRPTETLSLTGSVNVAFNE